MKVLAFAASSSKQSINKQLAIHATNLLKDQNDAFDAEIIDINDFELPLFSLDREAELGQPDLAKAFFKTIGDADAVIISFAEHNGTYTAAYKNLFDWASRIDQKVFQGKPMVLLSTSPGPGGAKSVLESAVNSAPFFGADVKASLSIPSFFDNFDTEAGSLNDDGFGPKLKEAVSSLI